MLQEIQQLNQTFTQFKEANDAALAELKKYGTITSETTQKVDRINTALDGLESKLNSKITELETKAAKTEALERQLADMEGKLSRRGVPASDDPDEAAKVKNRQMKAALFRAMKWNPTTMHSFEQHMGDQKALIVNSDTAGGYLAPPEYVQEIIMDATEYSPVRSIARQRSTTRHSVLIPKRTSTASASWVNETGTRTETTNPAFGMEEIRTHEMYAMTKVSWQELEDAGFNLEAFLRTEFSEQFGIAEGTAFISGSGNGKPEGIMTHASVGEVNSGHASQITADGLIALYFEPKEQYLTNASWILSRSTLKTIRQLKDGNGQYLWAPGIRNEPRPATILDRPYIVCPDMPSIGAGNYPVAFGDFRRAYIITDRVVIEMMSDPYTSKGSGMVEFSARKRVGGQIIQAEAIKKLKISA
jgi:HK97 family phage major capsid protein